MRIGIDVRYLSHGLVGGVHTYVKHFVAELCTIATDHQIFSTPIQSARLN